MTNEELERVADNDLAEWESAKHKHCQCEHNDHMTGDDTKAHAFYADSPEPLVKVDTIYGIFLVCPRCEQEHFPPSTRRQSV